MTLTKHFLFAAIAGTLLSATLAQLPAQKAPASATVVRSVFAHELPPMNGSTLSVKTVEVTYPPGGSSSPHSHPCPVIGYVISGAVRMQVKGEPEKIFKAGDTFYEAPNGVHLVSANASGSEPATFLATFVCDHETALSVPANHAVSGGRR